MMAAVGESILFKIGKPKKKMSVKRPSEKKTVWWLINRSTNEL
jgi:hypothetical protein